MTIPVVGSASPYPSSIPVSGLAGVITKVTVTLDGLSHTATGDLDVMVAAPDGQAAMLIMSDSGGGYANQYPINNVTLTFDDDATQSLPPVGGGPIQSGTYKPTNGPEDSTPFCSPGGSDPFPAPAPAGPHAATALASFNGMSPNGTWSLYVVDDCRNDSGSIARGWSITLQTRPVGTDDCKNGGWKTFNDPVFKNQGDCVSFVATKGRNPGNGQ